MPGTRRLPLQFKYLPHSPRPLRHARCPAPCAPDRQASRNSGHHPAPFQPQLAGQRRWLFSPDALQHLALDDPARQYGRPAFRGFLFSPLGNRPRTTAHPGHRRQNPFSPLRQYPPHGGSPPSSAGRFRLGPDGRALPRPVLSPMIIKQLDTSDAGSAKRWDEFVFASPQATFFHRAAWQGIIQHVFRHPTYFLYTEKAGEIQGVLPLAHVNSLLFGNALVALPFAVYGGVAASSAEATRLLESEAQKLAQKLGVDHL